MEKEQITARQGIFMISLFVVGSSAIIGGTTEAKRDSWIAIIIGAVAALVFVLIYARLHTLRPDQNIFELVQWVFGKVVGKIIVFLFTWYALHLSALVTRNFAEFFIGVSMPEVPAFFISLFLVCFRIAAIKSGIEVMGRLSAFFAPIIYFTLFGTVFLAAQFMDFGNIKPILYNGFAPVLDGAFSMFSFPFAEIVIFTMVFDTFRGDKKATKVYTLGLAFGFVLLLVVSVRNLLVLGSPLLEQIFYPSYAAVQVIRLGTFLQRFEVVVAVVLLICGFVKATTCAIAATKGMAHLFGVANYKDLASPVGLLAAILSLIIYKSAMQMYEWLTIYKYYALLFQVILPVIIWIGAECKIRLTAAAKRLAQEGAGGK